MTARLGVLLATLQAWKHRAQVAVGLLVLLAALLSTATPARAHGCETGGTYDPRAVGRAGERGWFQIHPVHRSWVDWGRLFDPFYNTRVAYRLSRGGTNWRPWTCRP